MIGSLFTSLTESLRLERSSSAVKVYDGTVYSGASHVRTCCER
jgi:hypothetical protein